ncbi:PGC-1 and ERR-induced regulator in muscle protein 1 [Cololabis saira]|uniref:PGC-1 and ERR-induced regulator in muscle protein 1 n=1 Tax=Cololabis saira TaxID=129043 RepID=UPI002AD542DB|nr:PGC-1 and ERR-induced regulator in muscle protein 1 [Cololabis saira]
MDDFEYSVEICDRDWESFYTESEECAMLPPSLAGMDDSGMSDIDEIGSILAQRAQRVDPKPGSSENDRSIDGVPDREESPVEHCLSGRGLGVIESVLSGSEEDIHLQSVNMFFERLKSLTEVEPNQKKVGNNREVTQKEEQCCDGQQATRTTLPKNFPKLNTPPARGETAVGKETVKPVDTTRTINILRKVQSQSNFSPEPAACRNLAPRMCKSSEIELFIREEACMETSVNDVKRWNQSRDSTETTVCSETTPQTCSVEPCTNLNDMEEESFLTSQVILRKKSSPREEHITVQESSPSASIKRKRRKKKRLSMEVGEGGRPCERQVLPVRSDSEEECFRLRDGAGLRLLPESFYLNEPQKRLMPPFAAYSPITSFPNNISNIDVKNVLSHSVPPSDSPNQHLAGSVSIRTRYTAADYTENNGTDHMFFSPLGQSNGNVISRVSYSTNDTTDLKVCRKLPVDGSPGLNEGLTGNSGHEKQNAKAGELQHSDKINTSLMSCENGQNRKTCEAEVKSVSHLQSAESCAPAVDTSQNDKLSAAKALQDSEGGNSGRDEHPLCQSEAEPQDQLESDFHNTNQCGTTVEKNHVSLSALAGIASHALNAKSPRVPEESPGEMVSPDIISNGTNHSPYKSVLSENPSSLDTELQTDHPMEVQAFDILSEQNTKAETSQLESSQTSVLSSKSPTETKLSLSEDLRTSPSNITNVSSCCTLDTDSLVSLSNENLTDLSGSYCSCASEYESGGQTENKLLMLKKQEEGDTTSGSQSHLESTCDLQDRGEVAINTSKAVDEPEKMVNSVFAMSSFWSEMEKLTINDILGLRRINKDAPFSRLPPLQENEETEMFAAADLDVLTQSTSTSVRTKEKLLPIENYCSRSVMWESEPVPVSRSVNIYPQNTILAPVTDTLQPVLTEKAQTCRRKISKTTSVHNLPALESESHGYMCKGKALQTLEETKSETFENCIDGSTLKQDNHRTSSLSSSTDSYSISLTDIFQYFFRGNQSVPSQSDKEDLTAVFTGGNSVPETYDHFFSEFDTESFFYPLTTTEEKDKDGPVPIFSYSVPTQSDKEDVTTVCTGGNSVPETYDHFFSEFDTESFFYPFTKTEEKDKDRPVPIFSYSRSAKRNLQFPEAYEYFYASSSSDDSSAESDEEENCQPVRVLSRFNRKPSSTHIATDVYDNFFTDGDLKMNFFSLRSLSFRNLRFKASTQQKQGSHSVSLVPVSQRSRSALRAGLPCNVLGNQDVMFPDPLIYHLDDRISRVLAEQPFKYEGFQEIISNPRLDASLLPIRQSDMCLVCIAFASWVLKTANPQVGDAWKAVLLANVSALSAIRYLRKYVRVEAAASEMKSKHLALTDS